MRRDRVVRLKSPQSPADGGFGPTQNWAKGLFVRPLPSPEGSVNSPRNHGADEAPGWGKRRFKLGNKQQKHSQNPEEIRQRRLITWGLMLIFYLIAISAFWLPFIQVGDYGETTLYTGWQLYQGYKATLWAI